MTRVSILILLVAMSFTCVFADVWQDPACIAFGKAPLAEVTRQVEADVTLLKTLFPCGETALQAKVLAGDTASVIFLLDHGAAPDALDVQGRSALYLAVYRENMPIVKELLNRGANPNLANGERKTPVFLAAGMKNIPILRILLESGGTLKRSLGQEPGFTVIKDCRSLEIMKYVLDKGMIDLHERGARMMTPLHQASSSVILLLLEKGADPSETAEDGKTALDILSSDNSSEAYDSFRIMLDNPRCPDINKTAPDGLTPMMRSLDSGLGPEIIKLYIAHNVDLKRHSDDGRSIWDFCKNPATEQLLLESGVDPNILSQYGETLLYQAVWKMDITRVKLLLKYKADPNIKNRLGLNPLQSLLTNPKFDHYQAPPPTWFKVIELANILMDAGFDPKTTMQDGRNWLHLLAENGYGDLVDRFVKAGVDINGRDTAGRTPIFHVQQGGMIPVLVNAGADVNARDLMGRTMLTITKPKLDPDSRGITQQLLNNGGVE